MSRGSLKSTLSVVVVEQGRAIVSPVAKTGFSVPEAPPSSYFPNKNPSSIEYIPEKQQNHRRSLPCICFRLVCLHNIVLRTRHGYVHRLRSDLVGLPAYT